MGDLVSRQAVLASIKNLYPDMPVMDIMRARQKWLEKYTPYFECENAIKQLPSVENKGEWILAYRDCGIEFYYCSKCNIGRAVIDGCYYESLDEFKKCPNCGADMR